MKDSKAIQRFLSLWDSLSEKEQQFIRLWLEWSGNKELLNLLDSLTKNDNSWLKKYKNPYHIINRLNEQLLLAIVLMRHNRLLPQFKLLTNSMSAYLLAEAGMVADATEYAIDAFKKAEVYGLAATTAYIGMLLMSLEYVLGDISEWSNMYNRVVRALNVQQLSVRNLYAKIYSSYLEGSLKKPLASVDELPNALHGALQEMLKYEPIAMDTESSYPLAIYSYYVSLYDIYFYLVHKYNDALHIFDKLRRIAVHYISRGFPNLVDAERKLTRALAVRRAEQGITLGIPEFINEGLRSLEIVTSPRKYDYFRFFYLAISLFKSVIEGRDSEVRSLHKKIVRHFSNRGNLATHITKAEFWYLYHLLHKGNVFSAKRQITRIQEKYGEVIEIFPFNVAFQLALIWLHTLSKNEEDKMRSVDNLKRLLQNFYPHVSLEYFFKALESSSKASFEHIRSELKMWFTHYPSVARTFALINPLALIYDLPPKAAFLFTNKLLEQHFRQGKQDK